MASTSSATVPLNDGWNLVGISETISIEEYLVPPGASLVKSFDAFYEEGNGSLDTLVKGKAYFVKEAK